LNPYKQLLKQAEETGDNVIGAIDGKRITKMFLMEANQVYTHKTFLEGTERGFTIVYDKVNGDCQGSCPNILIL
jgi:hypothetical protein